MSTKRTGSSSSSQRRRDAFVRGWTMANRRTLNFVSKLKGAGLINAAAADELMRACREPPPEPGDELEGHRPVLATVVPSVVGIAIR